MSPATKTSLAFAAAFALHYSGARFTGFATPPADSPAPYSHPFDVPAAIADALPPWALPLVPATYLFFLTLAGILAQVLWAMPKSKSKTTKRRAWWAGAARPLLISPLVLYATIEMAQKQPDAIVAGLVAFQNGFFWKTILRRR
jgi:hypothetical protein